MIFVHEAVQIFPWATPKILQMPHEASIYAFSKSSWTAFNNNQLAPIKSWTDYIQNIDIKLQCLKNFPFNGQEPTQHSDSSHGQGNNDLLLNKTSSSMTIVLCLKNVNGNLINIEAQSVSNFYLLNI